MRISSFSKSQLLTVLVVLLLAVAIAAVSIAQEPATSAPKPAATQEKAKATPATAGGDYVGSEVCITCHQDQDRRFKNTVMGR